MKRGSHVLLGTGLLLLALGMVFLSIELVQRHRAGVMGTRIAAALEDLNSRARLTQGGSSGQLLMLAEGSAPTTGSLMINPVRSDARFNPGVRWYVTAQMKYSDVTWGAFSVRLGLERSFLLPRPRVYLIHQSVMHDSIWTLIEAVFKEHQIDTTRTTEFSWSDEK